MMLFIVGCNINPSPKAVSGTEKSDTITWSEIDVNLYALDIMQDELIFYIEEEYLAQAYWMGEYNGDEAQGYLAFEWYEDTIICEFIGNAGDKEISHRFERSVDELRSLGFFFGEKNERRRGKSCICFGNASGGSCSDENCDTAEDCGNGKPKCRWKAGYGVYH